MEILELIKKGENEKIEFKEKVNSSIGRDIVALSNTYGGYILIGVRDDKKIIGATEKDEEIISNIINNSIFPKPDLIIEKVKIRKKIIILIKINRSKHLIAYNNIFYIRIGSTNRPLNIYEIMERANNLLFLSFDMAPNKYASIDEIDKKIIDKYIKRTYEVRKIKIDKNKALELLNIVNKNKDVTNGGYLFFSKNPQRVYPYVTIRIMEFLNENREIILNDIRIRGNLWEMYEKTISFLLKTLKKGFYIEGLKRKEDYEIPLEILREVVANAIVHRNYIDNSEIRIEIFPNKISIINPGPFPPGVSIESPTHKPRNPLIARYFYDIGIIDKYGSGIYRIINISKKENYPIPLFESKASYTKVVLKRVHVFLRKIEEPIKREIISLLLTNSYKSSELAKKIGVSEDTILRRINELIKEGFVIKIGKGKSTKYILNYNLR